MTYFFKCLMCCSKKGHFTWEKIWEEEQIEFSPRGKKTTQLQVRSSPILTIAASKWKQNSYAVALLKFGSEMGK